MSGENWPGLSSADSDAVNRYGFGRGVIHLAHREIGNTASVCGRKRCNIATRYAGYVTCEHCIRKMKA